MSATPRSSWRRSAPARGPPRSRRSLNSFATGIVATRWSWRQSSSLRPCGRWKSPCGRTSRICASLSLVARPSAGARCSPPRRRAIGVDLVPWLVDELAAYADDHPLLDVLIIDETSRLKDPSGKRARALLRIAGRFRTRWGLTGTPRPNSSMDLFMPAAIMTDGALWGRAFVPWQKRHFRPCDFFGREWAALPGAEAKIAPEFGTVAMTVGDP